MSDISGSEVSVCNPEQQSFKADVTISLTIDLMVSSFEWVYPHSSKQVLDREPIDGFLVYPDSTLLFICDEKDVWQKFALGPKSFISIFDEAAGAGDPPRPFTSHFVSMQRAGSDPMTTCTDGSPGDFYEAPLNCHICLVLPTDVYARIEREVKAGALRRIIVYANCHGVPAGRKDVVASSIFNVRFLYGDYEKHQECWYRL